MNRINNRYQSALAAAIIAVMTVGSTAAVWAQDNNANTGSSELRLEEIQVTAQRRTTDLQATAAAVSAYSGDDLRDKSMNDAESLGQFNASMDVAFYQGEAQIYIRGVGYSGIIGGTDSSTALHLDGVYMSRSSAAVPAFFDVDRVEVVRGPQGTLYGRNATGGSVNVISRKPTEEFSAEYSALFGSYDRQRISGVFSGPLIEDKLLARLAIQKEKRNGYTTIYRPGSDPLGLGGAENDIEDKDDIMARLTFEYLVSDDLKVTLAGDYYEADDAGTVWLFVNPGTGTNPSMRKYLQDRGGFLPEGKTRKFGSDLNHFNKPRIWGITNKIDWSMSEDFEMSSLTAYKATRPLNRNDLDTTAAFGVDQLREEDHTQFSQEFQFSYTGDSIQGVMGLYYFNEENDVRNEYFLPFIDGMSDSVCCLLRLNGSSETTAYAAFGEMTWLLADDIELVVGGRYGKEDRSGKNDVVFENFPLTIFNNVADLSEKSFSSFTPKIGINYNYTDDLFFYATVSEGFKSGGYNVGSYQNETFNPEEIIAYEIGMKADFFDQRVRVNTAAFFYDYQDLQIQDVESNNTIVRNAANAETWGLEIEAVGVITSALQIDFAVTLLNSEFKDIALIDPKQPGLGLQDLEGNNMPRAPEYKFVLGIQYEIDLGDSGSLMLRGDYSKQDKVYFSAFNLDQLGQDGYDWLKARASYKTNDEHWEIAAFADNITNEVVVTNATFNGDIIDSTVVGNLAPPRTYGLEVLYRY